MAYEDDIAYLKNRGIDVSRIRTAAYARRLASSYRRAEAEGRVVSRATARGHAPQPEIVDIPKDGHILKQRVIYAFDTALIQQGYELWGRNLLYLINHSPDPKEKYYSFVVNGIVRKGSPNDPSVQEGERRSYTYQWPKKEVKKQLKKRATEELYDFFEKMRPDILWLEIHSVSLAYPGEL